MINAATASAQCVATSIAQQRFHTLLVAAFSLLVFGLAVVGTYAVASYCVSERTGEQGIRMAVGATVTISDVLCWARARLAIIGIGIGGIAAAY